jgi:hypothetical protein
LFNSADIFPGTNGRILPLVVNNLCAGPSAYAKS